MKERRLSKLIYLFISIMILGLMAGCVTSEQDNPTEVLGVDTYEAKDIAYGSHREQRMDVYLPQNKQGPHPVMLLVHGGAWHWGDKSENEYSIQQCLEWGFVVVNMNYRMGDMDYTIQEKLEDMQSALNYIYENQEQWNLSDDLTLQWGSAGGHMVLQYGFTLGLDQVDRIVSYCGPTDLTNPYYKENGLFYNVEALFSSGQPSQEDLIQASPIFSIPQEPGPSVIMIHGNADLIVDFEDSKRLHERLIDAGWDSTLIEIPDVDHDFAGTDWNWVSSIYTPWIEERVQF